MVINYRVQGYTKDWNTETPLSEMRGGVSGFCKLNPYPQFYDHIKRLMKFRQFCAIVWQAAVIRGASMLHFPVPF